MMTHDEMIAVIQAAKDGRKIEVKLHNGSRWDEALMPIWNFANYDYRVKPEPRRVWAQVLPDGGIGFVVVESECKKFNKPQPMLKGEWVLFQEVAP